MASKLTWRRSGDADEYGDFKLVARATGLKFTIYPGSFYTLVAWNTKGERLFTKTGNYPGPLKAAATRYLKQVSA